MIRTILAVIIAGLIWALCETPINKWLRNKLHSKWAIGILKYLFFAIIYAISAIIIRLIWPF